MTTGSESSMLGSRGKTLTLALGWTIAMAIGAVTPTFAQEIPGPFLPPQRVTCENWIKFRSGLDRMKLRGRIVPVSPIDPLFEQITVSLSNANGTIFTETIPIGSGDEVHGTFRYRNGAARKLGGISTLIITPRNDSLGGYQIDVGVFADLSAATLPEMTISIAIGNDLFTDTRMWVQTAKGWRLVGP